MHEPFIPHHLVKNYLIFTAALVLAMAVISKYNAHPDEESHFLVAEYYMTHWLPPAIGDPAVRHTYSVWGTSYINTWGIEYLATGKLATLVQPIVNNQLVAMRLFNVALFFLLIAIFFNRATIHHEELIPLTLLLITPQAWYIFSYINNDAFPLFLSLLIVSEIASKRSLLNKFLHTPFKLYSLKGGILFGLMLGLLSISKQNYYVLFLFIGFWFIYTTVTVKLTDNLQNRVRLLGFIYIDWRLVKKYAFILLIAFLVFFARYSLDIAINGNSSFSSLYAMNLIFGGQESQSKLIAYQEEVAAPEFKPSVIQNDSAKSHFSVNLQGKGVPYSELFSKWRWHENSFKSFVGLYGFFSVNSPKIYYIAMFLLYVAFLLFLITSISATKDKSHIIVMVAILTTILLSIFISSYHSWTNALQAQGRYIFPSLSVLGLLVYRSRHALNNKLTHFFIISLFFMSAYSFIFVGLLGIDKIRLKAILPL